MSGKGSTRRPHTVAITDDAWRMAMGAACSLPLAPSGELPDIAGREPLPHDLKSDAGPADDVAARLSRVDPS